MRERISRLYCPHTLEIVRRGEQLCASFHRAPLVNASINFLRYGAEVEIDPGEMRTFFMVEVPLAGSARVRMRGRDVASALDCALVISPSIPFVSVWSADCAAIQLKIDRTALEKYVMGVIDRPLTTALEFDPQWSLSSGAGPRFCRMLAYLLGEIEEGDSFLGNRMLVGEIERSLMAYLVHCQPNTYSDALRAAAAPAAPRYVVRTVEFMRASFERPISIDDLTAESGVSARTLHEGFKQFKSTTPMAMLNAIRLQKAREALLAADARERVFAIAKRCGFSHLGRFSQQYRARYGESPSETLRRWVVAQR